MNSSSDTPSASQSNNCCTGRRLPRKHGAPLMRPGSTHTACSRVIVLSRSALRATVSQCPRYGERLAGHSESAMPMPWCSSTSGSAAQISRTAAQMSLPTGNTLARTSGEVARRHRELAGHWATWLRAVAADERIAGGLAIGARSESDGRGTASSSRLRHCEGLCATTSQHLQRLSALIASGPQHGDVRAGDGARKINLGGFTFAQADPLDAEVAVGVARLRTIRHEP